MGYDSQGYPYLITRGWRGQEISRSGFFGKPVVGLHLVKKEKNWSANGYHRFWCSRQVWKIGTPAMYPLSAVLIAGTISLLKNGFYDQSG